ncbi:transposase [Vitiosangium sp. GDMCC 1.1324]|uniref:transposase n=1 Tax=Vitiosangium sp. (strain GDMCC 1.1324) TaxID=2138576 RepID=UPI00130E9772|nr:transposase [Vitiosangium sp. GDMCC 1.1324]
MASQQSNVLRGRSFTPKYKAEAVRLVREGSKNLPQVAKDLDLTESALRNWVREADGGGPSLPLGSSLYPQQCPHSSYAYKRSREIRLSTYTRARAGRRPM